MRGKIAKALRRECNKLGMTPRGFRATKRKYTRLQPMWDEVSGKWISIKRQKKALCLS